MARVTPRANRRGAAAARLLRAPLALALLVVPSFLGAAPASAHASLTAATPEPESTSTGAPSQVQLHFRWPTVPDDRTSVSVAAPSGRDLATDEAVVTGLGVAQPLSGSDETGWFTVHYKVVFWDGHVDSGEFRFLVTPADSGPSLGVWMWVVGGVGTAAALCLLGPARRRSGEDPRHDGPMTAG